MAPLCKADFTREAPSADEAIPEAVTSRKCGSCGASGMVHETRTVSFEHANSKLEIPEASGWFCGNCGDAELDDSAGYFEKIEAFRKQVDGAAMRPVSR